MSTVRMRKARSGAREAGFDILHARARCGQTNNGQKVTKIVSGFRRSATTPRPACRSAANAGAICGRHFRHPWRSLLDAELLDAVTQRSKRQAEQLRGSGLVVACLLERRDDRVALDLLELRAERRAAIGARLRCRVVATVVVAQVQVCDIDLLARAKRERALENVL